MGKPLKKKEGLNKRQKLFCTYYVESLNATESAKKAGYSEKTAGSIGYENLTKPQIIAYIEPLLKKKEETAIASLDETLTWFTEVMRGNIKDQFDLDASLRDRIEAGKELKKRHETIENHKLKANENERPTKVVIVNDLNELDNE